MQKKILIVDDEPNNLLLLRHILQEQYQLVMALGGEQAVEMAMRERPDIVLLDIMMPGMDGYEVCEKLKASPVTREIPIIFITALTGVTEETKAFDAGAVDYVLKPVSSPVVLRRIRTHLSLVRAKELEDSQKEAIFMLGEAGHYNDTDTGMHIWRMAAYARAIAEAAGWPDHMVEWLELAAPMHDTGKIGIPDDILKAPRKLTPEEWEIMKTHSRIGCQILSKSDTPIFTMAAEIALNHHEKWDGTGYPGGLARRAIPESARIIALADVFDALTMKRPYKEPWSIPDAVAEIRKNAGTHFEPRLVQLFDEILPRIMQLHEEWSKKETRKE
ncbi:MAG: response regulator [Magnetococcus sp. DMHC-8]